MVRKRVPLQLISRDTSRRRTYRSRKNNLMKKAHEFRTLCGVSTCVIIYDPENPAKNPETYPKERDEVVAVIEKFNSAAGNRKMLGLPKFFEDRKRKAENELQKAREDNLKAKFPLPRDFIENLSRDQIRSLFHEVSSKILRAKNQLEGIDNLGVGLDMMEPPLGFDSQLNQFGSEVAWGASNQANSYMKNLADLPSTQIFDDNQPIQCQYPGQDRYNVSSLGNPNSDGIYYTSSGTFWNPALLQYQANPNLFMPQPQPVMQYMGPTSFPDLPPWQRVDKPGSSHNFDQSNYGGYGDADVASLGPPLQLASLPAVKMEWQKEQPSSSADASSFFNQYYYRG